jgi:ubiquinone/menaquinone biosynthesis C-methylase UbiE
VPVDPLAFFKQQKDHSFDIIICSLGIMYMEKEQEILREIHRVLTKDGHLISAHWTHPSRNQMLRVLKSTGKFMTEGRDALKGHSTKLEIEDHSFR